MATYYKDLKVFLLHPPKTGGTSLQHWFRSKSRDYVQNSPSHLWMSEIVRHVLVPDPAKVTWCITVRNPYDRIVSAYKFFGYYAAKVVFDSFVDEYCEASSRSMHRMGCKQVDWLDVPDYSVRVYKCENLTNAFPDIRMLRKSKWPHVGTADLITPYAIERVREVYAADFERFGYDANITPDKAKG